MFQMKLRMHIKSAVKVSSKLTSEAAGAALTICTHAGKALGVMLCFDAMFRCHATTVCTSHNASTLFCGHIHLQNSVQTSRRIMVTTTAMPTQPDDNTACMHDCARVAAMMQSRCRLAHQLLTTVDAAMLKGHSTTATSDELLLG